MKLSKLETLVLNATSDDYENIAWLTRQHREEVGDWVDEAMVEACLRRLAVEGLLAVFHYHSKSEHHEFVPCSFESGKPVRELWFHITEKGLEAVKENWNADLNES